MRCQKRSLDLAHLDHDRDLAAEGAASLSAPRCQKSWVSKKLAPREAAKRDRYRAATQRQAREKRDLGEKLIRNAGQRSNLAWARERTQPPVQQGCRFHLQERHLFSCG